jgi:ribosomal protein S7
MNNFFIFSKNQKYNVKFDYYSYFWYRYHRIFFRSLIFRGRKLWAFRFFINLKYELKKRELIDPFWVFLISLMKITPDLLLFPLKLGGVLQGVPLPISERKQYTFSIK